MEERVGLTSVTFARLAAALLAPMKRAVGAATSGPAERINCFQGRGGRVVTCSDLTRFRFYSLPRARDRNGGI